MLCTYTHLHVHVHVHIHIHLHVCISTFYMYISHVHIHKDMHTKHIISSQILPHLHFDAFAVVIFDHIYILTHIMHQYT